MIRHRVTGCQGCERAVVVIWIRARVERDLVLDLESKAAADRGDGVERGRKEPAQGGTP